MDDEIHELDKDDDDTCRYAHAAHGKKCADQEHAELCGQTCEIGNAADQRAQLSAVLFGTLRRSVALCEHSENRLLRLKALDDGETVQAIL